MYLNCEVFAACIYKEGAESVSLVYPNNLTPTIANRLNIHLNKLIESSDLTAGVFDIRVVGFLRRPSLDLQFQQVTTTYQQLVKYDKYTAKIIDRVDKGSAARKFASKGMSKLLSKVCVESVLQLALLVYEKAFSKQDIECRVGLTDTHVAQVLYTFQEMLKQRHSDGRQGLSDIQLGGHGTENAPLQIWRCPNFFHGFHRDQQKHTDHRHCYRNHQV